MEKNPLLQPFDTAFAVIPFSQIQLSDYKPAIEQLIIESLEAVDSIAQSKEKANFQNTIVALERSGQRLDEVVGAFFNLNSAETNDDMQALANELSPMMTDYSNSISQNSALFERIKQVYESHNGKLETAEDNMLLENTYKGFVRSGANLNDQDKERYKALSKELSMASLKFGENVLAETNAFELIVEQEEELKGLPASAMEAAALAAKSKGEEGKWLFTLQAPSFMPFMEYVDNRALREKMYKAYMSKAFKNDDFDNQAIVKKIVSLRAEKAQLLGYHSHADYVLEERMAQSPHTVNKFLNDLLEKALPKMQENLHDIEAFVKQRGEDIELQRWDWAYYSTKLKDQKYQLNNELLRPYFQMEKCVEGVFEVSKRLYGLNFKRNERIPVYHEDVEAYEVQDENGELVSVLLLDFFPRQGKRGGAWMTSYRGQWKDENGDHRPVISVVCNFTPPTEDKPALLTFNEVETLFHEFGHALHGMLADGNYSSLSGTSVSWDFVELPSQILENWLQEKECLDIFARHYQTDEAIPESYIEKIKASSNFMEGYQTVRQISFGLMDMAWHSQDLESTKTIDDVLAFEQQSMKATDLFPAVEGACMSTQFSHIFQGGYSAGYYSYKWAEVLDADAYSVFKEKGIFNQEVAQSFKANILSKGGSEHPMELYKRFRGQEPSVDALLERSGLK